MMLGLPVRRRLALLLLSVPGVFLSHQAWAATQPSAQFVDGIAAIVNKQVITTQQLGVQVAHAQTQLRQQNIPAPDDDTLRKQVLQRMILEALEQQEADRQGVRVSDAQLQQAVATIAQRNKVSVEQLRKQLQSSGVSWETYLEEIRQEIRTDQLRQRAVESLVSISESDIDAFLRSQGHRPAQGAGLAQSQQAVAPQEAILGLAQILVAVPEGANRARVAELRQRAEAVLARLREGADFAGLAASASDAPEALDGGELGVRPEQGWPELFLQATRGLQAGQVSGIVQSGNGFHILKVLTRGAPPAQASAPQSPGASEPQQGPMMVTQTHARHILIKTSKVVSDEQARLRMQQLAMRVANGESFEDLARRYSQDSTAPQGGDLGWLSPGVTVPPFEQAMDALQPGQISEPVQSQFGWHLIQVIERRTRNMEDEYRRMQARQILFQRRADPAYEDWLNQLRGQAYIDNRLDPQRNQLRRRP